MYSVTSKGLLLQTTKKKQENALKMMLQPTSGRRGFDYVKESTDDKSQ